MDKSTEEVQKILSLIELEQKEELEEFRKKIIETPLSERKKQGITWYPVVVAETEIGLGQKLVLEIERTSQVNLPHSFQEGNVASLFSNAEKPGTEETFVTGIVTGIRNNRLKFILHSDELPEWLDEGKLGLDLYYDEKTFREMAAATKKVIAAENNRLAELRQILLGYREASFSEVPVINADKLNVSQNKAVAMAVAAKDVAIIHGPPGTGKTTTLVEAIKKVLEGENQVLVSAPSNTAVDLVTEKLAAAGINVLRLGHPARVSEKLFKNTLDSKVMNHSNYKELKKLQKEAVNIKGQALKFKRNFGPKERENRKLLLAQSKQLLADARRLEKFILDDLLSKTRVITCTLVGANNEIIRNRNFKTVFIDEASQALEPACWIPISRAERVIFAGDHCQLPPTIKSVKAAEEGLAVTLFEKCTLRQKAGTLLEIQYRMNEKIMNFSSREFYDSRLEADLSVYNAVLMPDTESLLSVPVEFIDTAGCSFNEETDKDSLSYFNSGEANILLGHLGRVVSELEDNNLEHLINIGIISPYKAQVILLENLLLQNPVLARYASRISVDTVDGFQGQEREIIYISMVRSNDGGEIGFLADTRRMNVAMTRAKKKLVISGDSSTLGDHPFYRDFLDYVEEIGAYKSAWEFMD